jgi:hypothetical protein
MFWNKLDAIPAVLDKCSGDCFTALRVTISPAGLGEGWGGKEFTNFAINFATIGLRSAP